MKAHLGLLLIVMTSFGACSSAEGPERSVEAKDLREPSSEGDAASVVAQEVDNGQQAADSEPTGPRDSSALVDTAVSPEDAEAVDAQAVDSETSDSGDAGAAAADSTSPSPEELPKLHLAIAVHLEGWNLMNPEVFSNYVEKIRSYAQLANSYGAHLSWEARNLIAPSQNFGDNILAELITVNGDTVGLHADIGGPVQNGPPWNDMSFQAKLVELKQDMSALGISSTSLSGQCSDVDWVTGAVNAGFNVVSGIVDYCLKSLPLEAQSPEIQQCTNPADCHGVYPKDPTKRMHPWLAKDGNTWTTHDPSGELLIVPSNGSLVCLKENDSEEDSHTHCAFDEQDVSLALEQINSSLTRLDPDQLNTQLYVWSFGDALDVALFESFFQQVKALVDAGKVVWTTVEGIESLYHGQAPVVPDPTPDSALETGQVYIVIHCDPHGDSVCGTPGDSQWDQLVEIVAAADLRGHKLTLLMGAAWAECITASPARFEDLKSWVSDGHQLGYHHHDCSHPTPDGYRADGVTNCNTPPCSTCKGHLKGTVVESFTQVKALEAQLIEAGVTPALATIQTANMGPDKWCEGQGQCFRQHEWNEALIWGTETIADNPVSEGAAYHFLTAPSCRQYSDGTSVFDVLEIGHAQLDVAGFKLNHPDNNYQNIAAELEVLTQDTLPTGSNMGIVFHPQEYTVESLRAGDPVAPNDKAYIDAIFDLLATQGKKSVTVRDVMAAQTMTCP